ncbi:predicted protein [Thalassiosira pseudonana CCMP1335]|uniref:Uncharacterized protein n=1 Tax=Thalassiosira pseudonana TaxID=35128 RepID=B8C659_THAPS|nr:predicted protein [Thalassiosira pseudonana CCMP1335]EED91238.1 predicted protein [Thalassiosira pseudonana CCMP1335]
MDRVEPDETPAEAWKSSLDATCNRLMSHYLNLLRAASSTSSSSEQGASADGNGGTDQVGHDPRAGGGLMQTLDDPPPPLAADVAINIMQAKLAAENLCVASSNILDLIRTLRLSALLMDEEAIRAEEKEEALKVCEMGLQAEEECAALEAKLIELRNNESLGR